MNYSNRIKKLRRGLAEKKAGVFWLPNHEGSGQPATRYVSGFTGSQSHIFVTGNVKVLVTDARYTGIARKEARGWKVVDVATKRPSQVLQELLPKRGKGKVLVDGSSVTLAMAERIKSVVRELSIITENGLLQELRRMKDATELACLRRAAEISCQAFRKFLPHVKAGVTEKVLARKLADLLIDCGAEATAFDTIVASGKNAAFPHARPTDKKLRRGELVIIDFGARYGGYASDMTRTVAIGNVSTKLKKMYETVLEAQRAGCAAIRAGAKAEDVDQACRDALAKHGLEKYFTHATGHGLGLEIHELPVISKNAKHVLGAGEVITCEPAVYIEGLGGVRIEDGLIVTKNGAINLTEGISKELVTVSP